MCATRGGETLVRGVVPRARLWRDRVRVVRERIPRRRRLCGARVAVVGRVAAVALIRRRAEVRRGLHAPHAAPADVRRRVQRRVAVAEAAVAVRVEWRRVRMVSVRVEPAARHAPAEADKLPRAGHVCVLWEGLQRERVVQREAVGGHRCTTARVEHGTCRRRIREVRLRTGCGAVGGGEDTATGLRRAKRNQC